MSVLYYRTKDGRADYQFSFEYQSDDTWRIYIVSMPSYGYRDTGAHTTHRLPDGSRQYVCFDPQPRYLDDAKAISAAWADMTQEYIRTGITIDEQVRRKS